MTRIVSILLILPAALLAQQWSGVVDSSRAVDWSSAGTTIPTRSTICTTLSAGTTATAINSAIAACPSGQVVFLNAGTYNLTAGLMFSAKSNVTLRGAGADQTKLVFSDGVSCQGLFSVICVTAGVTNYPGGGEQNTATWSAGYSKGTTTITLLSTTNLSVGSLITLDQTDDPSDTGAVWVCQTQNVCSNGGPSGSGRSGRAQGQLVKVTAISGNNVTISPGLYMPNWTSARTPGAWWASAVASGVGIEELSIDESADTGDDGIIIMNVRDCWVSGIRSIDPGRNHIWIYLSKNIQVQNSYFFATQNAATQSYGVEVFGGSDNLIVNNIFQKITAPENANGSASGTVFAYNYSINDYYTVSSGWMMGGLWEHSAGVDSMLFEGNAASGFTADQVHGTHNFTTLFRNYLNGWETGKTQQTIPVHLYTGTRYFNVIGNVLGRSGYHTHYEDLTSSGTNGDTSVYTLGWSGNEGGTDACCSNDSLVASTLMRWGNYDVATATSRFVSAEVPSGLGTFANAVPGSNTLPASFFLSAQPSWWTSGKPWPAVGPDVTGGNIANLGGHAYTIPAQDCYTTMGGASDGSGTTALTFSSSTCYSAASSPTSTPHVTTGAMRLSGAMKL